MGNYNDFGDALAVGRTGEYAVLKHLTSEGYVVTNVAKDSYYFDYCDLIAVDSSGKPIYVEVKTDSRAAETGNLVIELLTNVEWKKDGWFRTSKADLFAFYLSQSKEIIYINADVLRTFYKKALCRIVTTTQYECGKYRKEGRIGLLSIHVLSTLPSFRRVKITSTIGG